MCKEEKEQTQFNKKKSTKDGLQTICKSCSRESFKKYWLNNKNEHAKAIRERNARTKHVGRQYCVDYAIQRGCVDCGENDPACLDFDHISGKKTRAVSEMCSHRYSIIRIQKEIDKCVVRCSNCHRKKTAKDFGWYKNLKGP